MPPPNLRREAAACLKLAGPLVAAQLSFVGMMVTDTLMAGRMGASTLAAVALGSSLWSPVFLFFLGICAATSPIVAQAVGAGAAPARIGAHLRQALTLALLLGAGWWLMLRLAAAPLVALLDLPPALAGQCLAYVKALTWGAPGACLFFMLRFAAEGLGQTRPVMRCALAGLLLNAAFCYVLMFGKFGLPALGAQGAGYATAMVLWLLALGMAAHYAWHRSLRPVRLFHVEPRLPFASQRETLSVGLPIAVTIVMEAGIFALMGLLMAGFGAITVAAHQIALSFAALAFMVPLGLALATTVRVGQALGSGDVAGMGLRGWTGIGLATLCNLFSTSLMLLKPEWITALYTDDPAVAAQAEVFLRLGGVFQLFDALQVGANGALRGLKDTRAPMWLTLTAYWLIGLPVGYGLAFHSELGAAGLWWGYVAGLFAAAALLSLRFARSSRRLMTAVMSADMLNRSKNMLGSDAQS